MSTKKQRRKSNKVNLKLSILRKRLLTQHDLLAIIEQAKREKWEELDLRNKGLTKIPSEIGNLTDLKYLHLGNRYQSKVNNSFSELPNEIGKLKNLVELSLYNGKLQKLPITIGLLKNLKTLTLHDNELTLLSKELGLLTNLTWLTVGGNKLETVPSWLGKLKNLIGLSLSSCNLKYIPNWVCQLRKIECLWFESNHLTDLPWQFSNLQKLKQLDLWDNPLNPVLLSAWHLGLEPLMSYLRSLRYAEPLYESKLILVGEGKVGKTTLLKALSGKKPRKGELTTHGASIDVHSIQLQHPDEKNIKIQFNAWDFGGQEVYRVTHQFFFSKRSVYLIVWEPRMGVQQGQVDDWLKLIRLRVGDETKVIIVSTHAKTGQRIARIDKSVLLRDYGSMIVGFIEIDSLLLDPENPNEKYNIPRLKELIANAAKDLEQMGTPLGKAWKKARDKLIEIGQIRPYIAYSEFAAICKKYGLESIGTRTLAGIMHDLGYVVYYGLSITHK